MIILLHKYEPVRNLRSGRKDLFVVPPVFTKTYGERSFSRAAPVLWNELPSNIKSINTVEKFKSALKTHLF